MSEAVLSSRVIADHPPVEIVEKRDDHTRIWEIVREIEITRPDGSTTLDTIKSYIHEKASGLCYKHAGGNYIPSVAEWRETPDGFVIDRCPYGLAMGKTIGVSARYTVEGNDLLLRPAYLIISDGVNQADLATLNPETRGSILPDNPSILRFPSAFGEGYDLEYVAENGGFHQNLIITNPPQLPAGFNPESTSIHLYTELNLDQYLSASGLEVRVRGVPLDTSPPDLISPPASGGSISFRRPAGPATGQGGVVHLFGASTVCDSPPPRVPPKEMLSEECLLKDPATAAAYVVDSLPLSYFSDGRAPFYPVVWDPPTPKSGPIGTQTWQSGVTYHVTDNVTVSGTLTIEGGAFVKINPYKQIGIDDDGRVIAEGQPGQYVKFTKAADNTAGWGEEVSNPTEGPYGIGLYLYSGSSSQSIIRYCMMRYGICAINCQQPQSNAFEHNIIDGKGVMYYGIKVGTWGEVDCINNLIYDSDWLGIEYYNASGARVCSNTIHGVNVGIQLQYSAIGTISDNVLTAYKLAGVSVDANSSVSTVDYNGYFPDPEYPQAVPVAGEDMGANSVELDALPYEAAGTFYLVQSCDLIERGSFWAPTPLDGPVAYSTCSYAKRDVGRADIGFHYTSYVNTDGDNLPDAWEVHYFGNLNQGDGSTSGDGDSLTAVQEFWHSANPNAADTDGDGYNDPDEVGVQEKKLLRGWGPAVYDFMAGPWLTNVTSSAVTIGWWVPDGASYPYLYYKAESETTFTELPRQYITTRDNGISGKVYERRLTGLSANTVYQYYVKSTISGSARTSPVCKFRTLESSPSSFTFIVYGDNRGENEGGKYNYDHFNENAAEVVRAILSKAPEAQFVLHVGDFVRQGGDPDHWREHFFQPTTRLLAEYPFFPVAGNHEYLEDANLVYYHHLFDYPDEPASGTYPTWYDFDYGTCRFVVMDSNTTFTDPSTQYDDLDAALSPAVQPDYMFFLGHHPPYSDSPAHPYDQAPAPDLRSDIAEDLLDKYNVEAHFGGHNHFYERWLLDTGENEGDIDYFVIGGGGAPLTYSQGQHAARQVATASNDRYYNFGVVTVASEDCTVSVWDIEELDDYRDQRSVSSDTSVD